MPLTELRIENYRSIRAMTLPLKKANIIVGPNGCGKSNLYQAMSLLHAAAGGSLAKAIVAQGGLQSALWAGHRAQGPVRLRIGMSLDGFDYDLEIGLPQATITAFGMDPHIKSEIVTMAEGSKRVKVLDRNASSCSIRDAEGTMRRYVLALHHSESVMSQIVDPRELPILDDLRRRILKWRFYHGFRTDSDSPLRTAQAGTRTYVLAGDGRDLAAALQTIIENGDDQALRSAFRDAFPGSDFSTRSEAGFVVGMRVPELSRLLTANELSDGTLRYLCLLAALLSPSPAPLLVLNEPENSLHEDLLMPLARLITKAAETSQIWLTTHSRVLSDALAELMVVSPIRLAKRDGETIREGRPRGLAYSAEHDG